MTQSLALPQAVDTDALRAAIRDEYASVADEPERGFHFHTGRPLARLLGYADELLEGVPEAAIAAMAGTGNPFALGPIGPGDRVVDCGSGSGVDCFIAGRMVGRGGRVIGVDMTAAMLAKARRAASAAELDIVEFREGYLEELPVDTGWADVVISNGVINLCPDKPAVFREMSRVLRPGGRIQVGDILVHREVPQEAKDDIELWSG